MVASHLPFALDTQRLGRLADIDHFPEHSWRAIHILAAGCRCSRGVAEHLAARGKISGLYESALLVGADRGISELIRRSALPLHLITSTEAADRYHVQGAPWLVVIAPDGSVRYAGGYARDRNARSGYLDIVIWKAVSEGKTFDSLPAFGCAVGQRVRRAIDPLGLKYSFNVGSS
jgi:hypothetical protein